MNANFKFWYAITEQKASNMCGNEDFGWFFNELGKTDPPTLETNDCL